MNNKLSIILTIYGRESFTQRWLKYHNDNHCDYRILIFDAKGDNYFSNLDKLKNDYPNLNCKYFLLKQPANSNLEFYFKKLLPTAIENLETEYFIFDDNDNFYNTLHFDEYTDFLDKNANYSGVRGESYRFWFYQGFSIKPVYDLYSKKIISIKPKNFSILFDSDYERINWFLKNADNDSHVLINWYSVYRREQAKKVFNTIKNAKGFDPFIAELFILLGFLNLGKLKVLKRKHFFQQHGTSESSKKLIEASLPIKRMFIEENFDYLTSCLNELDCDAPKRQMINESIYKLLTMQLIKAKSKTSIKQNIRLFFKKKLSIVEYLLYLLIRFFDAFKANKKYHDLKELDFLKNQENS